MQDLIAGRIDYLCEIVVTAKPQIDAGTVKAIATLSGTRSSVLAEFADRQAERLQYGGRHLGRPVLPERHVAGHRRETECGDDQGHGDADAEGEILETLGATIAAERRTPAYLAQFVKTTSRNGPCPVPKQAAFSRNKP